MASWFLEPCLIVLDKQCNHNNATQHWIITFSHFIGRIWKQNDPHYDSAYMFREANCRGIWIISSQQHHQTCQCPENKKRSVDAEQCTSLVAAYIKNDVHKAGFRPHSLNLQAKPCKHCNLNDVVLTVLCRVLYGNKITELPKGLFDGLVSLQLL